MIKYHRTPYKDKIALEI